MFTWSELQLTSLWLPVQKVNENKAKAQVAENETWRGWRDVLGYLCAFERNLSNGLPRCQDAAVWRDSPRREGSSLPTLIQYRTPWAEEMNWHGTHETSLNEFCQVSVGNLLCWINGALAQFLFSVSQ